MSKVYRVADDYAVAKLPPEIGGPMQDAHSVRIEIAKEDAVFWKLRGIAAGRRTSVEDAVARVRALRDDWD